MRRWEFSFGALSCCMLSRPYSSRGPDQQVLAGEDGVRYHYVVATRGDDYLFVYTHTGRPFHIRMGRIAGPRVRGWWLILAPVPHEASAYLPTKASAGSTRRVSRCGVTTGCWCSTTRPVHLIVRGVGRCLPSFDKIDSRGVTRTSAPPLI